VSTLLKRALVFAHRWLGAVLSILVAMWFASGIVMMYRGFPSVSPQDRLLRLPALDPERITLSAEEAFAALGDRTPAQVTLTSFDGRPAYVGAGVVIYADDGTEQGAVGEGMVDRAAALWSGLPLRDATKTSVVEVDQWTVGGGLRTLRPMYKYSWPDGQQVYVDGNTADVVQYTTTASRFWAYLGAIPHWLYFTPFRSGYRTWSSTVVWSALIGTAVALLGLVIAAWMYSPRRRYRHAGVPTGIPYRGWKRWHMTAGLLFGVMAVSWTFSGMLSMGPFPIMDRLATWARPPSAAGQAGRFERTGLDLSNVLRGERLDLSSYRDRSPREAIAAVKGFEVKEVEYTSFSGEPMYLLTDGRSDTRIVPVRGEPSATFDVDYLMGRLRRAAGSRLAELRLMEEYDLYYLDRRQSRPLPVIALRVNDSVNSRYYVDPRTATVIASYDATAWVDRWLYRGLHSLDFPWLYNNRPLWDVVVIGLLLGGTALSVTSVVLAFRVVARSAAALLRRRAPGPRDEDLAPEPDALLGQSRVPRS
jgi:hypothetical protein